MNKLTARQLDKLHAYHYFMDSFVPQFIAPKWLLKAMDKALPATCQFHTAIWLNGKLVVYIPVLCCLNPFYTALYEYRIAKLEERPNTNCL